MVGTSGADSFAPPNGTNIMHLLFHMLLGLGILAFYTVSIIGGAVVGIALLRRQDRRRHRIAQESLARLDGPSNP